MVNDIVFPEGAYMERDEGAPELFSVWLDDDLIGAGETAEEAMGEALS